MKGLTNGLKPKTANHKYLGIKSNLNIICFCFIYCVSISFLMSIALIHNIIIQNTNNIVITLLIFGIMLAPGITEIKEKEQNIKRIIENR